MKKKLNKKITNLIIKFYNLHNLNFLKKRIQMRIRTYKLESKNKKTINKIKLKNKTIITPKLFLRK